MFQVLRRNFWTIAKGTTVGYVEEVADAGVIFTNKMMYFRPTTSNLSGHGEILDISLSKCPVDKLSIVQEALRKRLPVSVVYEKDLFNSPTKGHIFDQIYLKDVTIDGVVTEAAIQTQSPK